MLFELKLELELKTLAIVYHTLLICRFKSSVDKVVFK